MPNFWQLIIKPSKKSMHLLIWIQMLDITGLKIRFYNRVCHTKTNCKNSYLEYQPRLVKNLKNANLILASNFEVFWGLSSKNLKIIGSNLPQSLNLKPKTATLILTSNFEAFWGFFKINLKYFSLPSTSKKPQTFFEVFLEDPRKPHTVHKIHQAFKTQGRLYRVTIK